MKKPRISLIIPAYNEEKYIGKTLESVITANDAYSKPSLIEIIVVNNCCTDDTEKIAKSFGVEVVFEEERRIASVRNKGASVAKGDIVAFLDADSTVTPNMFTLIDEVMSSGEYIGGGTDVRFERNSLGIFCTYCITKFPAMWLLGIMVGVLFTEKKTFEEMGGFDESLYCAEDSLFAFNLKKYGKQRGKKFKVIADAYVTTSARAFDKFGDWYYFKDGLKMLFFKGGLRVFKDKDMVKNFWYDIER
jgi:glycosyltransferase involved in cell wall biosynthesis